MWVFSVLFLSRFQCCAPACFPFCHLFRFQLASGTAWHVAEDELAPCGLLFMGERRMGQLQKTHALIYYELYYELTVDFSFLSARRCTIALIFGYLLKWVL
jgi:hypothetical protein